MSTETTLSPVTFVRDMEPGGVFAEGTKNKLWQAEDGSNIITSWASDAESDWEETMAYFSDDEGNPVNPMAYFGDYPGVSTSLQGGGERHEEVLEAFGYRVAE